MIALGLKTDPIETRFSFPWLFDLLAEVGIPYVQLGSFFELYHLDDEYFVELRQQAESRGLRIKSVFTAHRELGGFFVGDPRMERVARQNYEKLIHVAQAVGAEFVGSNPGAVYRDRAAHKPAGLACYVRHMKELQSLASSCGLRGLTVEPMSCLAEPPSTPAEIESMMTVLNGWHQAHPKTTVPVYLCGDISHGVADRNRAIIHDNVDLFRFGIPWMAEFHFKNTDACFHSTFGFSEEECERGIVDLGELRNLCEDATRTASWPIPDVVGYLEIGGPKVGRDYSDPLLRNALVTSLEALKRAFGDAPLSATPTATRAA